MSKQKGQTLVEFALVLPILLLVIFVIVESGRIFQAYVTVQHAAREGARYAVTGRWEDEFAGEPDPRIASIEAMATNALAGLVIDGPAGYDQNGKVLIRHYETKIFCQTEGGLREGCAGNPNEKVVVQVAYRLEIITPVLNVIAPSVQVMGYAEMINEDFGQLGGGGFAGVREPPAPVLETYTPGASPTPTHTPTGTVTPTPTETGTPTETPTITATPVCAVVIEEPVYAVDTTVTVSGDPGDTIILLDMDAGGATVGSGAVTGSGYCSGSAVINVNGNLVNGHIIAAVSSIHPSSDTACVGVTACWPTATPTATPTRTPTPTATPTGPYIALSHSCIPESQETDITVYGYNWPTTGNKTIYILWDNDSLDSFLSRATWFSTYRISASQATSGTHTVNALIPSPRTEYSKTVVVPCPPTPTPTTTATPLRPDLVITGLAVSPGTVITAYMPVTFTVGVRNQGLGDALSLFWVDLYDLPAGSSPPTAGQSQGDAAWKAVSSLSAGGTDAVILYYSFSDPGTRTVYGYVDTRQNIDEGPYEYNNASSPLTLTITAGTPPTATLNVDPVCIYTTSVPMTITLSGQGWPVTGPHDIQYDNIPRGSASGASWSTNISLNITDTAPGPHTIYVQNGSTVKTISYQPCSALGAIDGYARLFLPGVGIVFQERADIYCRDAGGSLIAQTTSGSYGYYVLEHIPPGSPYTVIGQTTIDDVLYIDTATGITVTAGITERVNLLLMPQY